MWHRGKHTISCTPHRPITHGAGQAPTPSNHHMPKSLGPPARTRVAMGCAPAPCKPGCEVPGRERQGPPDLMSLWRKRQLFRRLAELPRQQVTSPYSCMILIISHMAVGAVGGIRGRQAKPHVGRWAGSPGEWETGEVGCPLGPSYPII